MRRAASAGTGRIRRIAWVLAALCGGCGFSTGLHLNPDIRNIGVEVFGNDSAYTDLERDLHAEVTRSIRNISDVPLAHPERADLVIRGRIISYFRRGGIRSKDNRLIESGLQIEVVTSLWTEAGIRVAGPTKSEVNMGYTLDAPGHEREARERALKILADTILLNTFSEVHALEAASSSQGIPPGGSVQ
jgi:hypothetical protein